MTTASPFARAVTRVLDQYDAGLYDDQTLEQEVYSALSGGPSREEAAEALDLVTARFAVWPELFSFLIAAVRHRPSFRPPIEHHPDEYRDAFVAYAREVDADDPVRAARLTARLPSAWIPADLLRRAADTAVPDDVRHEHLVWLLPRLLDHDEADTAHRVMVEPHLELRTHAAVELLVAAYLDPRMPHREVILAAILRDEHLATSSDLVRIAARLSIELRDDDAVALARRLVARGELRQVEPEVLAQVLWYAGEREEAEGVAAIPVPSRDTQGWYTQATDSLAAFRAAQDADPATVLDLLARDQESYRSGIATVGALVARLALMRMRAALALGQAERARWEALAVVLYAGHRGWELHVQQVAVEFEVAFVDRLAVTDEEIAEARAVTGPIGPDDQVPRLYEGRILIPEA